MRRVALVVMFLVLAGCGSDGAALPAGGSVTTAARATTSFTVSERAARGIYATNLLLIRQRYLIPRPQQLAAAADALNLVVPATGFALRHKQLIDELLRISRLPSDPLANYQASFQRAAAAAQVEIDLVNLAHEADPTAS